MWASDPVNVFRMTDWWLLMALKQMQPHNSSLLGNVDVCMRAFIAKWQTLCKLSRNHRTGDGVWANLRMNIAIHTLNGVVESLRHTIFASVTLRFNIVWRWTFCMQCACLPFSSRITTFSLCIFFLSFNSVYVDCVCFRVRCCIFRTIVLISVVFALRCRDRECSVLFLFVSHLTELSVLIYRLAMFNQFSIQFKSKRKLMVGGLC